MQARGRSWLGRGIMGAGEEDSAPARAFSPSKCSIQRLIELLF